MSFLDTYDPGPRIANAGAINVGTQNIEKSLWFFRDVLGMEEVDRVGDTSYLRCYMEHKHHSLVLTQQDENLINTYAFRTGRSQDPELFGQEFARQGLEVLEIPSDTEKGRGTAIRFLVPGSEHPFELYYDIEATPANPELKSKLHSNSSRRRGLGVRRLDHFNVQAEPARINEAENWVRQNLGFRRREYAMLPDAPDTVMASWMSVTSQSHDLAMVANQAGLKSRCHHLAFYVGDFSDALTAADILADLDVRIGLGPGKHGIGQAMYLYVFDPGSGHRVELYAGGYQIFDPDWKELQWAPAEFPEGLTWYGDPVDMTPGSEGRATTPSAGLHLPGRKSLVIS